MRSTLRYDGDADFRQATACYFRQTRERGIVFMCSLKIRHILLVTACMLSPLLCAAQAPSTDDHATYLNFAVPGALGTYPMSINASMTVTGYYFTSPANTGGFLRAADALHTR